MNTDNQNQKAVVRSGQGGRALARPEGFQNFTPRSLEERRLINRNDNVRVQANAFRDLRTQLLTLGGNQNFVTLVAPVSQGCGGSFVARNLAAAFAFDETKAALLVDCDALNPSQHTAMGVRPDHGGLMDYLDGSEADLSSIQYPTGVPGLDLLPSGSIRETTGEYFSSVRIGTMVDSLRSTQVNRYIILDSPPALTSPDARILADLADVIVLVAGYARVTTENIEKAAANFDPGKLAGIVFNELR